jgi:hypothetical protein
VAGEAGFLARHSSTNASLAAGRDLKADPAQAWASASVPASAPVSCPAASAAGWDLGVSRGQAASQDQAASRGLAAAADSGGRGSVESPAAGDVAAAGAAVGADLDALRAAWVARARVAVDAAAAAGASSNRGAHTKDDPHSSDPNSRRD